MILAEKTNKELGIDVNSCKTRDKLFCQCDYCGDIFLRKKASIDHKWTVKDSCGKKECSQQRREEVSIIKYGAKNYAQTDECKSKIESIFIDKFGGNPAKLDSIKKKTKQTCMKKYGVECYTKTEEYKQKQKDTFLENYGNECYFHTEDYKSKSIKTNFEKYGVMSAVESANLPESFEKAKTTLIKRYGTNIPSATKEAQEKRKKTSIEKYGLEHYSKTNDYKVKAAQTSVEKYGHTHYAKTVEYKTRQRKTLIDKYGVTSYPQTEFCKQKCLEIYGVPYAFLANKTSNKSEKDLSQFLTELGYKFSNNYTVLNGKEIDLFNEDLKIGIEYCGLYWHTELSLEPRERNYHYNKYKDCQNNEIQLITIFSDEWKHHKNKCKSIIASTLGTYDKRIYARKCKVVKVDKPSYFFEMNHLRGKPPSSMVCFGLENGGELVAAMSLGSHPRNASQIVLDRMCSKMGVQVVGGASKLFKTSLEWLKNNNYQSLITWSDNRWSQGKIYPILGFSLDKELLPDYSYVDLKNPSKRLSKQSQKKSSTGCPEEKTEREWAIEKGLARIWDCGKKRWVYHLNTIK